MESAPLGAPPHISKQLTVSKSEVSPNAEINQSDPDTAHRADIPDNSTPPLGALPPISKQLTVSKSEVSPNAEINQSDPDTAHRADIPDNSTPPLGALPRISKQLTVSKSELTPTVESNESEPVILSPGPLIKHLTDIPADASRESPPLPLLYKAATDFGSELAKVGDIGTIVEEP